MGILISIISRAIIFIFALIGAILVLMLLFARDELMKNYRRVKRDMEFDKLVSE